MARPTVVQSAKASGLLQSSLALTLPGFTENRLLVAVICGVRVLGAPTFSLSDDQGNTWSEAVTLTLDVGTRRLSLHTTRQSATGKVTLTVTPSATADLSVVLLEFSSVDPLSAVAATGTATGTGLSPSKTLEPLSAEGILIAAFTHLGVSMSMESGAGFQMVQEIESPASGPTLHVESEGFSTPALITADGTLGLSATWGLLAVAFRQWNTYFVLGG